MNKAGFILLLLVSGLLAGCVTSGTVAEPFPVAGVSGGGSGTESVVLYNLQPLDPLMITLLGIPEEKAIETSIAENGQITLPYLDDSVQAAGLSVSELEREIQRLYTEGKIYRSITVNIQTSAKSYFMEGEVMRPQEYPLNRRITLLQAIAAASGYTEYADKKDIMIIRQGQIIKVNGKELEKHPERDIPIESGDRIKVDRTFY